MARKQAAKAAAEAAKKSGPAEEVKTSAPKKGKMQALSAARPHNNFDIFIGHRNNTITFLLAAKPARKKRRT